MSDSPTTSEIEAFLDESLPPERMAAIEEALRDGDDAVAAQVAEVNGRRDAGLHSLGEVWRRRRLTCPTREQLGSYLLGVLDEGHADYVRFHLETVACRWCIASLEDLQARQLQAEDGEGQAEQRRRRYFQSSVGRLDGSDAGK
ncbi:MAG: hypothetical protein AAGB00_00740 [Planctomycetota bacterium]